MRATMLRGCVAAGVALAACGTPPTTPFNGFNSAEAVQVLVTEIVDTMQQQSFKRDQVPPDETITSQSQQVARAVQWLQSGQ